MLRHVAAHARISTQALLVVALTLAPSSLDFDSTTLLAAAYRLDDRTLDGSNLDSNSGPSLHHGSEHFPDFEFEPRAVSGSWLAAVHRAIASLRHQLNGISAVKSLVTLTSFQTPSLPLTLAPRPHLGGSSGFIGTESTATGNEAGSLLTGVNGVAAAGGGNSSAAPSAVTFPPSRSLIGQTGNEADLMEDREIVNDIQAMEWCMWPAFLVGGALFLTSCVSTCTSPRPNIQSLGLGFRFFGNLSCSAVVLWLLAWAAQHHREDCEKHLALVGMLAFFVEWVFIWSGMSLTTASVCCVRRAKTPEGDDVVVRDGGRARPFAFRPRSVYLNCLRPTSELYARFTIQSLLMWLYVSGVHKKARELVQDAASGKDVVATRVFLWWILSAGVQLHMTEQMGSGFVDNLTVWSNLWKAARRGRCLRGTPDHPPTSGPPDFKHTLSVDEVLVRMSMDFVSNLMYYNLMYISVPVLLVASKQPIELVMNAFAVTYILTLDDERQALSISILEPDSKEGLEEKTAESEERGMLPGDDHKAILERSY
jgi:hypothetical protein